MRLKDRLKKKKQTKKCLRFAENKCLFGTKFNVRGETLSFFTNCELYFLVYIFPLLNPWNATCKKKNTAQSQSESSHPHRAEWWHNLG